MSVFIYPYKAGSKSVKALKDGVSGRAIKLEGSKFKGSNEKLVINWGNSTMNAEVLKCKVLNHPEAVALASNKKSFFEKVEGEVSIPPFTTNKDEAFKWIEEGKEVVVREKLTGNSGEGIVLLEDFRTWDNYNHTRAKLYVKYIPKKDEYRIHVMGGEVIDYQRKAKRNNYYENVNWKVRNYDNGFVFVREGVEVPTPALEEAVKAVALVGLDFGAVDVVWNNYHKQAYVLEVNTAPGLEGTTVENYINGLTEMITTNPEKKKALSWELDELVAGNAATRNLDRDVGDIIADFIEGHEPEDF